MTFRLEFASFSDFFTHLSNQSVPILPCIFYLLRVMWEYQIGKSDLDISSISKITKIFEENHFQEVSDFLSINNGGHLHVVNKYRHIGLCCSIWTCTIICNPKWDCVNMTDSSWKSLTKKVNETITVKIIHVTIR